LSCLIKKNITGIELIEELYILVKNKYSKNKNIKLINCDFLKWITDKQFDLIIGNPPYFEMYLDEGDKKKYIEIISGRVNMYSLFI